MARIVDRTRALAGQARAAAGDERAHLGTQLDIMWRRARLIRQSVTFAGCSMLVSCVLVLGLFTDAFLDLKPGFGLVGLFVTSIVFLAASLVAFLRDIFASLRAVQMEVERTQGRR